MIKLGGSIQKLQSAAKTLKAHLLDPDTFVGVSQGHILVYSNTGRQEYNGLMPQEWAGYCVEWRFKTAITMQGAILE